MSLVARARSVPGTLRQDVTVAGVHHLTTDEPEDVGGDGSAPSPHELLPAAVAACISTTLVMFARRKGWALEDVEVEVAYDNRSTPRRFDVAVCVSGDLDASQVELLEKVAASCPVRRALEAEVVFEERLGVAATG
ncbi:MAG TPA: OsmC family protein [Gaiellaceae bacterium]|nr:OsmC family protein [Gaiellaceae bacterium]